MPHVDWLTAWQEHPESPDFGSVLRVDLDPITGEYQTERMLGESVELPLSDDLPSHVSHLRVRSHHGVVEVSGNPSKWGRLEALAGGVDLNGAFAVYNKVLADLGLPIFSGERWLTGDHAASETVRLGARISRLDLADCLSCGSAAGMRAFLDWLPSQRWGRRGHRWARPYAGYCSVGTIRRAFLVCYDKGDEVEAARARWLHGGELAAEQVGYLGRVAQWATENGIVRWELRLGTAWLSERGRNRWVDWREGDEAKIMGTVAPFPGSPGVALEWRKFAELFQAAGFSPAMSHRREAEVLAWLAGADALGGYSRPTRYRAMADIRKVLGFDLREPCNVAAIGVRVRREVTVSPVVDLPSWYRRAA